MSEKTKSLVPFISPINKIINEGASWVAQWGKVPGTKPGDLSWIFQNPHG